MTLAFGSYGTNQSNTVLVPAYTGQLIRVVRVVVTAWTGVKVVLLSNPGPDPVALTPPLHVASGMPLVLHMGRSLALSTGRGQALGISTAFQGLPGEHSIAIWYEAVD